MRESSWDRQVAVHDDRPLVGDLRTVLCERKYSFYSDNIWEIFISIDGCLSELIITLIVITCSVIGADQDLNIKICST